MRIVGHAVFPLFSELGRLGDGAYVSRAAWQRVTGSRLRAAESVALVRLAPGVALDDVVDDLQRRIQDPYGIAVISQGKPTDIVNFGRVESTPYVLGALLALVSLTTLAYILVSSVRRRRRELAVLKTLGFVRRQVRVAIAGQATTVAALALLVGIPIGVALGRFAWTRFADDLGIVTVNVVSVPTIVVSVLAVLVVANVVAAVPATLAGRTRPADALRTE